MFNKDIDSAVFAEIRPDLENICTRYKYFYRNIVTMCIISTLVSVCILCLSYIISCPLVVKVIVAFMVLNIHTYNVYLLYTYHEKSYPLTQRMMIHSWRHRKNILRESRSGHYKQAYYFVRQAGGEYGEKVKTLPSFKLLEQEYSNLLEENITFHH